MTVIRFILCLLLFGVSSAGVYAKDFPAPKGKPILTISGNIANTNVNGTAQFDRDALENMGLVTVETQTPWYETRVRFEGVSMAKLMEFVGAKGETVKAVALNDYVSTIPVKDFTQYNVILAMKRDGEYMQVRDKGPLFIIYPYDSMQELQSQTYYTRSAWQVAKLIVE
ncbi:oxidoreductase [Agrobacterium cavarae]